MHRRRAAWAVRREQPAGHAAHALNGSIVGTRKDLQEALEFAGEGKVQTVCTPDRLENINAVLERMGQGKIDGRVVMRLTDEV